MNPLSKKSILGPPLGHSWVDRVARVAQTREVGGGNRSTPLFYLAVSILGIGASFPYPDTAMFKTDYGP